MTALPDQEQPDLGRLRRRRTSIADRTAISIANARTASSDSRMSVIGETPNTLAKSHARATIAPTGRQPNVAPERPSPTSTSALPPDMRARISPNGMRSA